MSHILKYWVILFFLSEFSFSQLSDINIQHLGSDSIFVNAGETKTLTFKIINNSNEKKLFDLQYMLPPNWKIISKDDLEELWPKESNMVLLSYSIPITDSAGSYQIKFGLREKSGLNNYVTLRINVLPIVKFNIELIQKPKKVEAGYSYIVEYLLRNKSNVNLNIYFNVINASIPASVSPKSISVAPGESPKFTLVGEAAVVSQVVSRISNLYNIGIIAKKNNDTLYRTVHRDYVEIVPLKESFEEYHKLPVYVIARGVKETAKGFGFQGEISGKASLIDTGSTKFEFLIKAPDINQKSSLYYLRDEYRVSLLTKQFKITLGDFSSSLSPLTDAGTFGFGGEGTYYYDKLSVFLFQQKDRFYNHKNQFGTSVYYSQKEKYTEKYRIGINFLNINKLQTNQVFSVAGNYSEFDFGKVRCEFGLDNIGEKAIRAELSGQIPYLNYYGNFLSASPNYSGIYKDVIQKSAGINISPFQGLNFSSSYSDNVFNAAKDSAHLSAPHNLYYGFTLSSSRLLFNSDFGIMFNHTKSEDLLKSELAPIIEDQVQLNGGTNIEQMRLSFLVNFGRRSAVGTFAATLLSRYFASINIPYGGKYNIQGFVDYFSQGNTYGIGERKGISAGVSASMNFSTTTRGQAQYSLTSLIGTQSAFSAGSLHYLNLRLEQIVFKSHQIIANAKINYSGNSRNLTGILVEYRLPLGIPLSRKTSIGVLKGRIFDIQNKGGYKNVILYADGMSTTSDENGDFEFPIMQPGTYYLLPNKASLGDNMTTAAKMPLEVVVKGGDETYVEIGVSRSSKIKGRILQYTYEESGGVDTSQFTMRVKGGVPGFVLMLQNGHPDVYTTVSNMRGEFTFQDLPPGKWKVKIVEGKIPDYHSLDQDSVVFDLASGESKEDILFNIKPKRRMPIIAKVDTVVTETPLTIDTARVKPFLVINPGVVRILYLDNKFQVVDPTAIEYLDKLAEYLKTNRYTVNVVGHTDPTEAPSTNEKQRLSDLRATKVRDYLVSKGVSRLSIRVRGMGDREPKFSNSTASGRMQNRRVEVTMVAK